MKMINSIIAASLLLAVACGNNPAEPQKPSHGDSVEVSLPSALTYTAGDPSTADVARILAAYSDENCKGECLDSICGVLAIGIKGNGTLNALSIVDNNPNACLDGKARYSYVDNTFEISGGSASLVLSGEPLKLSESKLSWIMVVVPRGAFPFGFKLKPLGGGLSGTVIEATSSCLVRPSKMVSWEQDGSPYGGNEKMQFNSIRPGTLVQSIDSAPCGYMAVFSDGSKVPIHTSTCGYMTRDAKGMWCVNGISSRHPFIGSPYYTPGANGKWLSDGVSTDEQATPAAERISTGGILMANVVDNARTVDFNFTDGSSLSFPKSQTSVMYVKKTSGQMDVYIERNSSGAFIAYPFYYRSKAYGAGTYPAFLDNWGMGPLRLCENSGSAFTDISTLFLKGEAEMAVSVTDGSDPSKSTYVGGTLHGFENIVVENGTRALTISVDGKAIGEKDSFELMKAEKIVMTQKSLICQAYTNSNPFAEVFRTWTFEDGDLSISIQLHFLRDIKIAQAQFGMVCVLRHWEGVATNPYLTRYAVRNSTPRLAYLIEDNWQNNGSPLIRKDHAATRITEYGDKGLSFALCVDEATLKDNGGMFCGTNGNAYNKIYFDLTGSYQATAGETLSAKVHWEIDNQ